MSALLDPLAPEAGAGLTEEIASVDKRVSAEARDRAEFEECGAYATYWEWCEAI